RSSAVECGIGGGRAAEQIDHVGQRIVSGRRAFAGLEAERGRQPVVAERRRRGVLLAELSDGDSVRGELAALAAVLLATDAECLGADGAGIGSRVARIGTRRFEIELLGGVRPGFHLRPSSRFPTVATSATGTGAEVESGANPWAKGSVERAWPCGPSRRMASAPPFAARRKPESTAGESMTFAPFSGGDMAWTKRGE